MHQAQITHWGQAPTYTSVDALPPPKDDELRLKVSHAGLHRVVRSRASGSHYSSGALPHVPGIDGVGTTAEGKSVYFFSMAVGSYSEEVNIPTRNVFELPGGMDPVTAAAMVNPAMSSWMGFKARTSGQLKPGFNVLILGATSASGRLAAVFAKELGAGRVIGAARNQAAMDEISQLDEKIVIASNPQDTDFSSLGDVDVIIDYVYGALTLHLLNSLKSSRPVDYVQIGGLSGEMDISLPGAVLRSKDVTLRGSGPGSWAMSRLGSELPGLLEALKNVKSEGVKVVGLSEIEAEWQSKTEGRVVFEI